MTTCLTKIADPSLSWYPAVTCLTQYSSQFSFQLCLGIRTENILDFLSLNLMENLNSKYFIRRIMAFVWTFKWHNSMFERGMICTSDCIFLAST